MMTKTRMKTNNVVLHSECAFRRDSGSIGLVRLKYETWLSPSGTVPL